MCSNPLTITHKYPFGTRTYTVPCGKCADCVKKKRSGIAALSQLQANASGTVYFITFTYRNDTVPVSVCDDTADGPRLIAFERGCDSSFFPKPGSKFDPHQPFGSPEFHNFLFTDLDIFTAQRTSAM